jgi:hypothetical protein
MKAAWVAGWARPITGREKGTLAVFMEAMDFWDKRIADAKAERREVFMSTAGHGMVIIYGDHAELSATLASEEYLHLAAKIELNVEGLHGEMLFTGEGADKVVAVWAETAQAQGYM